jgi:repressor LexA
MRGQPSDVQTHILREIARSCREDGMPPTNREIGQALAIQSTGHVDYHLRVLEQMGYLEREEKKSRGMRLTAKAQQLIGGIDDVLQGGLKLPVYGRIAAGQPLEVHQEFDELLDLGAAFAGDDVFALKVKGKSMIDDHIDDGDYVVVRRASTARDGDTVVAMVAGPGSDGEATLKRFYRERDAIRLQPANAAMEPIRVAPADVTIQGRVISVIRRV